MHKMFVCSAVAVCIIGLAIARADAQVMNPADAAKSSSAESKKQAIPETRYRSWEYPPIDVVAQRFEKLREEDRIGSYEQPLWTATRRFTTTRVYIVPEGKMELEYWMRVTRNKDGSTDYRTLQEVEFGLPHRFQLDIYMRTDQEGANSTITHSQQIELRYAFADWGVIPGNPTLYLEWIRHEDEPDQLEPKLLLGGEIIPRWHWGLNLVDEFQLGGEKEAEYSARAGVSYAVIDSKFALGVEGEYHMTDTKGNRGDFEKFFVLGPSFQYRPFPQMTINFSPMFGITSDSPDSQTWFNLGWEF